MLPTIPSQITPSTMTSRTDLVPELDVAKASGKNLIVTELLVDKSPLVLKMIGHLTTDAIQVDEKYGSHTIGFAFNDPADLEAFSKLVEYFDECPIVNSEWKIVDMIKNDRLYLKLKNKNNKYFTRSNLKLVPKSAADAPLVRYQNVEVQAEVKAYFSLDNKSCGFYLDIFNLLFEKN